MRILFIPHHSFPPQVYGGIETATLDICNSLLEKNLQPAVLAELQHGDLLWLRNRIESAITGRRFPRDWSSRFPVYRGWRSITGVREVARQCKPDAVVIQARNIESYDLAIESVRLGLTTFYYVHDAGVFQRLPTGPEMSRVRWIANSRFTARGIKKATGISADIVPVLTRAELYRTHSSRRTVTMINPRPLKGGDIALRLAQMYPDIPFLLVEAWQNNHSEVQSLKNRFLHLKNVMWLESRSDMRPIYGQTRILLAPSQCEETWGRVVTEAQYSGIPAIASDIGALPDTVGPGGLLLHPKAPLTEWATALRALWDDEDRYRHYAEAAFTHSQREEMIPANIIAKFLSVLRANLTAPTPPVRSATGGH